MMKELMSQILGDGGDGGATSDDDGGELQVRRMTREPIRFDRDELLRLSQSPHVRVPDGMPRFENWFG